MQPFNLYFVSGDRGFGGRRLLPELRTEAPANLVFYNSIDRLLDRLSCPADPPEPSADLIRTEIVTQAVRSYLTDGQVTIDIRDWQPDTEGSLLRIDDELFPQPRTDETRACRIGETVLVATNRVWGVRRRYAEVPHGGANRTPPPEVVLQFSVLLAILTHYEGGELINARVVSGGAIRGH